MYLPPPHAFMFERAVPWSAWYFIHLFLWHICLSYFACPQISHGGNFPHYFNLHVFHCWSQQVLTSMSCDLVEFPHRNLLPRFNHCMCLVYHPLNLNPIHHDDPDGIILSNFMLALVVLNNSIIKPPSFHLPFIYHPSFMDFVKLKRSWFSFGTIFTSEVSFAMDPSLCLQITFSFPF